MSVQHYSSCEQCKYVDMLRGVHPMRCCHPEMRSSLPTSMVRAVGGLCGPGATKYQRKDGAKLQAA